MKPFDGEVEEDLYTDEQVNEGHRGMVVNDDESPRSLTWVIQSRASPPAVKTHSNRVSSLSSSSTSLSAREGTRISTLNCQLTKTSPLEADTTRSSSASMKQDRRPCEESTFDKADSQSHSLQAEAMGLCKSEAEANSFCSCLQSPYLYVKLCIQCNTLHHFTCALLQQCNMESHRVVFADNMTERMEELRAALPLEGGLRVSGRSVSPVLSNAAMSSLVLGDEPKSIIPSLHPITYHNCCDLAQPDPQVLCVSCSVFHSGSCRGLDFCQINHKTKPLGVCSCGTPCSRNPPVLCRYCGNEYCRDCWYRNPVVCKCGQTFDQSSSVWFVLEKCCTNEAQLAKSQCLKSAYWRRISCFENQIQKKSKIQMLPWHNIPVFLLWSSFWNMHYYVSYSVSGHIYHCQHFLNVVCCCGFKVRLHLFSHVT